MIDPFQRDVDALIAKFAELLTGDDSPATIEKVKLWSVYNHMHKTMPALTAHWGKEHPAARGEIRKLFEEIKSMNEALRDKQKPE